MDEDGISAHDILELVDQCMGKLKAEARRTIGSLAKKLAKQLEMAERTHHNILKNKAILKAYKNKTMPEGVPPYRSGFDTTANNDVVPRVMQEWAFTFNDVTVTILCDEATRISDWKEAWHHAKISAYSMADQVIGRSHLQKLIDTSSCEHFQEECEKAILEASDPKELAMANDSGSEYDFISPLDRIDVGQADILWKRDAAYNKTAVVALYKKTVEVAKMAVAKTVEAKKGLNLKKAALVQRLCESDPSTFVTAMVKKELQKTNHAFDVDYSQVIRLTGSDEYLAAGVEEKKGMLAKFISKSKQKNGVSPAGAGAQKSRGRGNGRGRGRGRGRGVSNSKGKSKGKGPKGKADKDSSSKGKGKGKGKSKEKDSQKGKGKGKSDKPYGRGKGRGKNR